MHILVIGSGGREHALVWRLARTGHRVVAAPGNPGIEGHAECVAIAVDDHARLVELAVARQVDLAVVGPEAPLVAGLAPRGHMVVVGAAADPITVQTSDLIFGTRTLSGSLTGSSIENEDNLTFSVASGVRPMNEITAWTDAPKAYEHMMSGQARFRVVLDMAVQQAPR